MEEIKTKENVQNELHDFLDINELNEVLNIKVKSNDIIIFPEYSNVSETIYSQETFDFIKYCKHNNTKVDILCDKNIKVLSLNSFDIWMPIIYILENVGLPLVIGLIANYISNKKRGREKEKVALNVKIIINGKKMKEIHYNGDADTFKELMD